LALLGFLLAIAPLAIYAIQQTDAYNNRVSAVFLLSEGALRGQPPLAALDDALGNHALMFNVEGDANGRHHAPHYPLLDFVTGLGFLVGCGLLLRHWRDWRMLFLAAALAITMLPSLFAVQGPHAMRSIGAIAFACTIAALGWVEIGRIVVRHAATWRPRLLLWSAAMVVALVLNARVYFVAMPAMPGVWQSFYPIHTRVGVYVRQVADEEGKAFARQVYVPQGLTENDVFTYLVYGLPVQNFKGDTLSRPAEPGALFVLSGYSHAKNVENLRPYIGADPPLVQEGPDLPGTGEPSFFVYRHK
jgi:4-amino-4-deoxy-L-arabinose transferase-like glycosyltransferase